MPQAQTPNIPISQMGQATVTLVSRDTTDDAGDPITYISTPSPEVTSAIVALPPGGKTDWMTHPCPGYLYVLEGELTVEFEDGHHLVFKTGQAFMQARTKWASRGEQRIGTDALSGGVLWSQGDAAGVEPTSWSSSTETVVIPQNERTTRDPAEVRSSRARPLFLSDRL